MKKIPTLFNRIYENHKVVGIEPTVTNGMDWVLRGDGIATVKIDGSCCAVIGGRMYKRYDAKKGKKPPVGAIPCCEPDPITGHHPHWVELDVSNPADKWYVQAFLNCPMDLQDGTYEAIGPHFQGNPYGLSDDIVERHGLRVIDVPRSFEGIRDYLEQNYIEGIVFWKDGEPQCKIKRSDFGFEWNSRKEK